MRDFVYKRSPHQAIAARFTPTFSYSGETNNPTPPGVVTPTTSDKKAAPTDPLTPVAPNPKTTSSSTTSSSPTPTPSTPTSTSSTPTSSSSSTSSTPSIVSTPPPVVPIASTPTPVTHVVTSISSVTTTSSTPTATQTPSSSSGPSTTAIVGGVAGALVGIAVLGFIVLWCMRRQRDRDMDDFDASAFKRQSAILVDDPVEPPQSYNPRPPTMIERHNASPALAAQAGFGGQNFYGNYGGYNHQPSFGPPEMGPLPGSPAPHPYGSAPAMGYAYNEPPQQLARQPSNAAFLTRQPSSAAPYGTLPPPPDAHYVDLNRSSVSPFQAAQYADISNGLGTPDLNAQVVQPQEPAPLPEAPLPSPFDDPVESFPLPPTTTAPVNEAAATPAAQPRPNPTEHAQRPTSSYTVYEEGDAYAGI